MSNDPNYRDSRKEAWDGDGLRPGYASMRAGECAYYVDAILDECRPWEAPQDLLSGLL